MYVELGLVVVELVPSGDLAWCGVLSEYGRRLHPLVGGVGGVGVLGLVVSGSVSGDGSGESGVGGSESVAA